MNAILETMRQAAATAPRFTLADRARAVLCAVARAMHIHGDRARLQELPDYLLRDIGITRSEIDSVTMLGSGDTTRRPRF